MDRGEQYRVLNLKEPTDNLGVELLGTLRNAPFTATASYAYVRSREADQGTGQRLDVAPTPSHSLELVGIWEKEGAGRVGIECYYTGRQRLEFDPFRSVSEPYVILGVMGERRVAWHVRLFINPKNLIDVRQTRWGTLLRPNRAVDGRWTVDAWAPLDGRNINGGVRLVFRFAQDIAALAHAPEAPNPKPTASPYSNSIALKFT